MLEIALEVMIPKPALKQRLHEKQQLKLKRLVDQAHHETNITI
jgi:hypothetical protein